MAPTDCRSLTSPHPNSFELHLKQGLLEGMLVKNWKVEAAGTDPVSHQETNPGAPLMMLPSELRFASRTPTWRVAKKHLRRQCPNIARPGPRVACFKGKPGKQPGSSNSITMVSSPQASKRVGFESASNDQSGHALSGQADASQTPAKRSTRNRAPGRGPEGSSDPRPQSWRGEFRRANSGGGCTPQRSPSPQQRQPKATFSTAAPLKMTPMHGECPLPLTSDRIRGSFLAVGFWPGFGAQRWQSPSWLKCVLKCSHTILRTAPHSALGVLTKRRRANLATIPLDYGKHDWSALLHCPAFRELGTFFGESSLKVPFNRRQEGTCSVCLGTQGLASAGISRNLETPFFSSCW